MLLLRVAGSTDEAIGRLRGTDLARVAARCEAAADELDKRSVHLCDALHALVPGHDDGTRRTLLQLKRSIHNRRPIDRPLMMLAEILPGPLHAQLKAWREELAAYHALLTEGERETERTAEATREALTVLWRDPLLRRGVLHAQPGVYEVLQIHGGVPEIGADARLRDRREELTLLAYVYRMVTKASPFGTLTLTGVARLSDGLPGFPVIEVSRFVEELIVAPSLIGRIAEAWEQGAATEDRAVLCAPDLVEMERDGIRFLVGEDSPSAPREVLRTIANAPLATLALLVLQEAPEGLSRTELLDRIGRRLGGPTARLEPHLDALLRAGLVRARIRFDAGCPAALENLLAAARAVFGSSPPASFHTVAAASETLANAVRQAPERQHQALREALSALEQAAGVGPAGAPRVFDRCALPDLVEVPASPVRAAVPVLEALLTVLPLFNLDLGVDRAVNDELAEICATGAVGVLSAFEAVRHRLAERVAADGCPLSAAAEAHPATRAASAVRASMARELDQLVRGGSATVHLSPGRLAAWGVGARAHAPSRAPLSATFLGQLAEVDGAPIPAFVYNSVLPGHGRVACLAAREGNPAGEVMHAQLASRLARLDPSGEVVEIGATLGFGGQIRSRITDRVLPYPGERSALGDERTVDWASLVVTLDATLGRPVLFDTDRGRRVLPVPLGPISPQYFPPLHRFLVALGPAFTPSFSIVDLLESDLSEEERTKIRHYARVVAGPTVLSRESWCVPSGATPIAERLGHGFAGFLELRRWARGLGLPRQVFVTGATAHELVQSGADPQRARRSRKPFYLDFDDHAAYCLFRRFTARVGPTVRFTEALPTSAQNPFREGRFSRAVELGVQLEVAG